MKKSLILLGMLSIGYAYAQQGNVGINNSDPKGTLDVQPSASNLGGNTNEGIIAPRLTKVRIANIAAPVEGTLVYATNATYTGSNTKVSKITEKGYYFYNGTEWVKVAGGGDGKTILNGATDPTAATGALGDFYINTATNKIYGPKTNTGWGSGVSLVGPKGDRGEAGPAGANGAPGAIGPQGPAGDTGVVTATNGLIYTAATKTISLPTGTSANQVLKWNGTAWIAQADANNTYLGSTSIFLNGRNFEREALTGDVTSSRNSNTVTINNSAVTGAKLANNTITADKLSQMGATDGQVLKWNGTAWVPSADNAGTILPDGNAVGDILEWDGTKWVAKKPAGETATSSFTRNIRIESKATTTIGANDYFIHFTSNEINKVTLPSAKTNKGRVLCFYNENGSSITLTPQPKGAVQGVQSSQTSCFISNGNDWVSATGF